MQKKVIVIGAGFAGLAVATSLANKGFDVTILEKNETIGGRARLFEAEGFKFDMGPSWYWMPDVFETYFGKFGKKPSDYYELIRLDPSYAVIFSREDAVHIPAKLEELKQLFESIEEGSGKQLEKFLQQAAYKYEVGMGKFVWKPSRSITEFISLQLLYDLGRMDVLMSFAEHVRKFFKHPKLLELVEFPILFLGATPENTPAMYSLMNYAEMTMGTWYPMGGMYKIVEGMAKLATEKGVRILVNQAVKEVIAENKVAKKVITNTDIFEADVVVSAADYHHTDTKVLGENRNYSDSYWDKRTLAPSALLYYLGINKKLPKLLHHNLFFDEDFKQHAFEIYTQPQMPTKPLFYVSAPSKTDPTVAPEGYENLFILIPVATGLTNDTEAIREQYLQQVMTRLEEYVGEPIMPHIIYKRTYAHSNFIADYNAFKGNAYGLANTLLQTAFLKPTLKNKKLKNMFYTGQLTVPGPGVPPSLISGLVVADEIAKEF